MAPADFIEIGISSADLNVTNDDSASVGSATTIVAGGAFSLNANTSYNLTSNSHSDGGGFIASAESDATLELNNSTVGATVGNDASITASTVSILAQVLSAYANATGEAFAGGLFGDTDANGTVSGSPLANVTIDGGGTQIDGLYGVAIFADQKNQNLTGSATRPLSASARRSVRVATMSVCRRR